MSYGNENSMVKGFVHASHLSNLSDSIDARKGEKVKGSPVMYSPDRKASIFGKDGSGIHLRDHQSMTTLRYPTMNSNWIYECQPSGIYCLRVR